MRALPSGTVGKAMPVAMTPWSKRAREKAMVSRPSPRMMGRDGGLAGRGGDAADIEAGVAEFALEVAGVGPEALDALGLGFENVEGGDAGGGDGGWMRGGEEEGAGAMVEVVNEIAGAADVAAETADGLGEGADLDVDLAMDVEVIDGAAAVAAEDARGVGVVDHHDGVVLPGESGELVDGADVAVHRKDAVRDDELAAGLVLDFFEELFGVGDIFVAEDLDLGAGETGAIDDGGVVQFVRQDEVAFAEDGGDSAGIGGEAGLEDDAGLDVFEAGDLFFELHVDAHGAGDGADGAGADAEFFGRGDGGFAELGVIAEAEIVVAGEVDDLFAVVGADGGLLVVEDTEAKVGAAGAQVIEDGGEVGQLGAGGGTGRGGSGGLGTSLGAGVGDFGAHA